MPEDTESGQQVAGEQSAPSTDTSPPADDKQTSSVAADPSEAVLQRLEAMEGTLRGLQSDKDRGVHKVSKKVDKTISDTDLKAENAVSFLYDHKIPISKIEKIFSVGLLGLPFQRRLVPTRWSITGVDDIIGKGIRNKVKSYQQLSEVQVFHNEYIGNHYEIILLPGAYEYELIEMKKPKSVWNPYGKHSVIYSDYESYWGRKDYASATGGAFYAGRLSVLEYLDKIKRQSTILIIREVLPAYYAPLGIWQMRETIRGAFKNKPEKFNSFNEALRKISTRISTPMDKILKKSKLFQKIKEQRKIKQYLI